MSENLTQADIEALLSEYEGEVYGVMHTAMLDDQEVIYASEGWANSTLPQYLKGFPPGFKVKVTPYAQKGIEIAVNSSMTGEKPKIKYTLPDEKVSAEKERKRKETERFFNAILQNIADRSTINPFKDGLRKQHGLGAAALSFPFRWDVWDALREAKEKDAEDYDRLLRDFWPWDVYVTHPYNMMGDPEADPPEHYITRDEITYRAAKKLYPNEAGLMEHKKGRVKRVIYLSQEQYTVIIGGQVVIDGKNPCNMIWHEWLWGGYGSLDEQRRFEHLGKGLIRDAKGTLARVVANENIADAYRAITVFTPRQVIHPEGEEEAEKVWNRVEFGPNKGIATGPNVSIKPLEQNIIPDAVRWSQEETRQNLELIFGQAILSGSAPVQPLGEHRQRVNLAETPFLPAAVAMSQAIGNMLRKMGRFTKYELGEEKYRMPSGKYGGILDIDPNDLLEDGIIEIDLTPPTADDLAITKEDDAKEVDRGFIGPEEYRIRQGILDGEKQDKDRAINLIKFHPSMVEAAVMIGRQKLLATLAPDLAAQEAAGQSPATVPATTTMTQPAVPSPGASVPTMPVPGMP